MRSEAQIAPWKWTAGAAVTLVRLGALTGLLGTLTGLLGAVAGCGGPGMAQQEAAMPAHHEEPHVGEMHAEGAEHHEHAEDEVYLTEAQSATLEVRVAPAGRGNAAATVRAPATVAFDPDRVVRVGPRVQAKVVRVTRDLGDRVVAGDTVAILESPELGRARSAYLSAQAALEAAEAHYRRDQPLAEERIVSQTALQESRARYHQALAERDAAREELRLLGLDEEEIRRIGDGDAPLSRYELKTPGPGVVEKRDLVPGETVTPDETPIHVVDAGAMWVMADVYEQALPRLAVGQPVTLRVAVLPGRVFEGEVDWISAALDEKTRTVRVRAVVDNPDGLLKAGMFGTADVQTQAAEEERYALVPVDALQSLAGRPVVFVPAGGEEGAFRVAAVVPGEEAGGEVEIRSGLLPGQPVVVEGAFDLMSALTARERSAAHSH